MGKRKWSTLGAALDALKSISAGVFASQLSAFMADVATRGWSAAAESVGYAHAASVVAVASLFTSSSARGERLRREDATELAEAMAQLGEAQGTALELLEGLVHHRGPSILSEEGRSTLSAALSTVIGHELSGVEERLEALAADQRSVRDRLEALTTAIEELPRRSHVPQGHDAQWSLPASLDARSRLFLLFGSVPPQLPDFASRQHRARSIARHLARQLAPTDWALIWSGVKGEPTEAACRELARTLSPTEMRERVFTFVPRSRHDGRVTDKPTAMYGTSLLVADWPEERRDQLVRSCHVCIACAGQRGTAHTLRIAERLGTPAIPIPVCGGSSERMYSRLKPGVQQIKDGGVRHLYEALADVNLDSESIARSALALARALLSRPNGPGV